MDELGLPGNIAALAAEYDAMVPIDETIEEHNRSAELARNEEAVFHKNLKKAMEDKTTRELVVRILVMCGLYDIHHDRLEFFEGRRSIGCEVLKMLALADDNLYTELIKFNLES